MPQLAWFVHIPKTGGTNVYELLQGKRRSCGVATKQASSCGPHGMIVSSPMQIGLVDEQQWLRTCNNPKLDDGAPWHTATGVTCGAFRGLGSTSFSGNCYKNMHWSLRINLKIAAWARRSSISIYHLSISIYLSQTTPAESRAGGALSADDLVCSVGVP